MKTIIRLLTATLLFSALCLQAAPKQHYQSVAPLPVDANASIRQLMDSPKHVTVVEFFNFGCPACQQFEPALEHWLKTLPQHVVFERVPVVFEAGWETYAKAFYIAKQLNVLDKMTPLLFAAGRSGDNLSTQQSMADLFVKQGGVSADQFASAYNFTPYLVSQALNGKTLMMHYKVYAIPTIVIDGKYKTNMQMSTNLQQVFSTLDMLVHKQLKAKGLTTIK